MPVHPPKHITGNSTRILKMFVIMIPHIAVAQKIMENIDPSGMMIPTDTIKAMSEITLDQLIDSRDTN